MCQSYGDDIERTYRRSLVVRKEYYELVKNDEIGWHFRVKK